MTPSAILLLAAALAPGFGFRVDPSDAARYASPGSEAPTGVAVRFRTSERDHTRVDVLVLAGDRLPRWRWVDAGFVAAGAVTLRAPDGARALLVLTDAGDQDYRLDGPFRWPGLPVDRRIASRPARTVGGRSPFAASPSELRLAGTDPGLDPLCESDGAGSWQCSGVPRGFFGRAVACRDGAIVAAAEVRPASPAHAALRPVSFAALLRFELAEPGPGLPALSVRILRPAPTDFVRRRDPLGSASYLEDGLVWIETASESSSAWIEARAAGYPTKRLSIGRDESHCTDPIPVLLSRGSTLRGAVTDRQGSPVPGALVLVRSGGPDEEKIRGEAETDPNGEFEIPALEPGDNRVRACHGEHGCVEEPAFSGAPVRLRLPGLGAFIGRVLSSGGVPQAGAAIRILPTTASWASADDRLKRLPLESRSGPDGRFRISAAENGEYLVEARTETSGVARVAVRRSNLSPPVTDLGDVRLPELIEFTATVSECGGGSLVLSGPLGGETSLPAVFRFRLDAAGSGPVRLTEGGAWAAWASCAGGVDWLEPALLPDATTLAGLEVRFDRASGRPAP